MESAYVATQTDSEALFTLEEAARFLAVSRSTTYRLIDRGELPLVRIGGNVRVRPADVRALVERSVIVPARARKETDPGDTPSRSKIVEATDDVRPS